MLQTLRFLSSKCCLFHNATFFGSCIIRILHTGCAKILMPNSGAKRLIKTNLKESVLADAHIDAYRHTDLVGQCVYMRRM
jgi:hypothetical protein